MVGFKYTAANGKVWELLKVKVTLRGGRSQWVYFFAKEGAYHRGEPADLPEDREVFENPRNHFPTAVKKRKKYESHV